MLLPLWYAILLGLGFIIFLILIFYCIRLYPNYSIFTRTISGLGHPDNKSAKIFNPAIIVMGILLILFPYYVFQVLPAIWLTYVGIGLFFCVPIGLILVGVFPEHKEAGHMVAAALSIGGALLTNIFLFYPILISDLSIIVTVTNVIVLITCVPLAIAAQKTGSSYVPDQHVEKILHNLNFWEWTQFIVLQTWMFTLYLNLLITY
ncbi:MAG: DUF998 domain-containing protein [Promethearchaeota archaeon]